MSVGEEDIGAVTLDRRRITINKKWAIVEKIASGGFGAIYKALEKDDPTKAVVIKTERRVGKNYLEREVEVFKRLNGKVGFPRMHWKGKIYYKEKKARKGCSSIVMDVLGPSLSDLFYKNNKCFSLKTVLLLADQMIKRLETMHELGIIHRDIKPGNFCMGIGPTRNIVYLIDFGLANFYRTAEGAHIPYKTDAPFRGTHRYASLNAHYKIEQSRRDDLEGLGYVLIYFLRGGLPWQNIDCSRRKRRKFIGDAKRSYSLAALCEGLPVEFREYMEHVRNMQYFTDPPYRFLRKLFKRCFRREGFVKDYQFDWVTKTDTDATSTTTQASHFEPSDSSLSTMSDDGVFRPLHDPNSLKRLHDGEEMMDEPPQKRARLETPGGDYGLGMARVSSEPDHHQPIPE